ncbi:MAG: sulfatase [Planctomycetota bacterium]
MPDTNPPISRRRFMQATAAVAASATALPSTAMTRTARPPNVLFIAIDDLNDWIGPLGGHPDVHTPNLDRLAQRGFTFANTSCPAPICTPARSAVLTGVHPTRSGLYLLQPLFRNTPTLRDRVTLPQHFRNHGYRTMAVGKVFHGINDPDSFHENGKITNQYGPTPDTKLSVPEGHPLWDWGIYPDDDRPTPDDRIADWAIERINRNHDEPFFLGAGFFRPHVPMYAPAEWFEHYPKGKTRMPEFAPDGWRHVSPYITQLTHAAVAPRHDYILALGQAEHAVRSYLASVSYMDSQVGKLLDALADSPHADNTLVVFWSDHGFHLGEKNRWGKRTLWEESCRVPLILAGPGVPHGRTDHPTGTIHLYPTLTELCGLPPQDDLDGHSLTPLMRGTDDWPHLALTCFGPGNCSVRSQHHRYTRYADGTEELYDHRDDPGEWDNRIADPDPPSILDTLRSAIPDRQAPLTPGSAGSDSPLLP